MISELLPFAAAASLAVLAGRFVVRLLRSRREPPEGGEGGAPASTRVIGREMARAENAERRRREAGSASASPMPAEPYDRWRGDFDLYDPVRLPLDDTLAALGRRFATGDVAERESARRAISIDESYTLLNFARRAAVFAVRERSVERAWEALAALAMIERERVDSRDLGTALVFAHHGAARAGGDADALLGEAAALAEPGTAEMIRDFASAPAKVKELGLQVEVDAPGGPGLLERYLDPYHPTRDLTGAALGVAALVSADRYLGTVALGTGLPAIWLGAADPAVIRALARVRAGATVRADLRPRAGSREEDQTLVAFLVETVDDADAQALLDASRKVRSADHAVLGAAVGPLFCLLVSSSTRVGRKPAETTESLARFADGLARVLARHAQPS